MLTIDDILAVRTYHGAPLFTPVDAANIIALGYTRVDDILLSARMAARYLGIGRSTLTVWQRRGIVPSHREPGGVGLLYRLGDLRRVVRPLRGNPTFRERSAA